MSHADLFKLRQRLMCRIGRRYRVVTEEVAIGELRFPFTRIADPDRVLDEVAAEADLRDRLQDTHAPGDELHLPYWAELWESARGIGEFLVSEECRVKSEELQDTISAASQIGSSDSPALFTLHSSLCTYTILDLGCGMGMAGTVAAALGARVVFADLETPALLFAQLNSLPWRRRVQTRRLNWQRDQLDRRFDLILGADILYESAQWPFLETFWRAHLADGGQVLLGEPGRQTGDMFIEWIAARGWRGWLKRKFPLRRGPGRLRIFIICEQKPAGNSPEARSHEASSQKFGVRSDPFPVYFLLCYCKLPSSSNHFAIAQRALRPIGFCRTVCSTVFVI